MLNPDLVYTIVETYLRNDDNIIDISIISCDSAMVEVIKVFLEAEEEMIMMSDCEYQRCDAHLKDDTFYFRYKCDYSVEDYHVEKNITSAKIYEYIYSKISSNKGITIQLNGLRDWYHANEDEIKNKFKSIMGIKN
jgi:hypothetical protein